MKNIFKIVSDWQNSDIGAFTILFGIGAGVILLSVVSALSIL